MAYAVANRRKSTFRTPRVRQMRLNYTLPSLCSYKLLVENDGGRGTDKSLVVIELNYFGAFTAKFRRH